MFSKSTIGRMALAAAVALGFAGQANAQTATYNGQVEMLEVWANGNVAFRLYGITSTCAANLTFVLNKSSPGTPKIYAAVLAAKLAQREIRVWSSGCGPAENYGATPYVQIDYLYVMD